jgi:predicted phage terminase large subunit-like protein
VELRRDKNAKSYFANTGNGSRFTTSVGSAVTGQHAHCLIIDDPVDPQKAMSEADRLTANEWMGNIMTRSVRKDLTPLILIMQRLHEDDPTATIIKNHAKVRHIRLPADEGWDISPPELRSRYVDGLLDPIRVHQGVLDDQERILGPYGFAGQFGQDPRPREGGLFQREWFEIVDPKDVPKGGIIVRGWDLAASKKKLTGSARQAATSGVKLKLVGARLLNGKLAGGTIYVLDDVNFFGSSDAVRRCIRDTTEVDGLECIQDLPQDPGQAGKSQVQDLVALLHGYRVRYSTESGDKVVRADPFSAQCEAGNVKIVRGAWNDPWLDEMTLFPNGLKDRTDATVRAYSRLIKEFQLQRTVSLGGPKSVPGLYKDPIGSAYE